jgi:hypothetical protein
LEKDKSIWQKSLPFPVLRCLAGICGNPNHDHTFTIGRPRAWSSLNRSFVKTFLKTFSS